MVQRLDREEETKRWKCQREAKKVEEEKERATRKSRRKKERIAVLKRWLVLYSFSLPVSLETYLGKKASSKESFNQSN